MVMDVAIVAVDLQEMLELSRRKDDICLLIILTIFSIYIFNSLSLTSNVCSLFPKKVAL